LGRAIWLKLSNGTFHAAGGGTQTASLREFITAMLITSLTIDSPNGCCTWAKLDNLIVGNNN
jgi:hypothetical protein